jgi:hypothetical protein
MAMQHHVLMLNDGITVPDLKEEVKVLQRLLQRFGVLDNAPNRVDGLLGNATLQAVQLFQGRRTLQIDGKVGKQTWAALLGVDPAEITIVPRPGETTNGQFSFTTTYPPGKFQHELDEIAAKGYNAAINRAAVSFGLQPSLIAGIGSRESNWGLILSPKGPTGTGDHGHGRGLMQIDDRTWGPWLDTHDWRDAETNIRKGCAILADNRQFFETRLGGAELLILHAALAGYNAGPGNVLNDIRAGRDIDHHTAGGDYSKDVFNRAGWYQKLAHWA